MKQQAMAGRWRGLCDRVIFSQLETIGERHWRQSFSLILAVALVSLLSSCSGGQTSKIEPSIENFPSVSPPDAETEAAPATSQAQPTVAQSNRASAEVLDVAVTGNPGAYTFSVTIRSPDTGCDQYADWWEILSQNGQLHYRRILLHSHVNEQPFTRSGGPAPIQPNETVIVRAHMHPDGYGASAKQGSVSTGFTPVTLPADFAAAVAEQAPQPSECNF